MNTRSRFIAPATVVVLAFLWMQASRAWSDPVFVEKKYNFAQLLDELNHKGQELVDIEQGQFGPEFDDINLNAKTNYLDALTDILAAEGWAYEMRGSVMVLYDKKLRASGDRDFLNLKIAHLRLTNVTREQCFQEIAKELHITIFGGGPLALSGSETPKPNFDIELSNITLREALYIIVFQSHHKIWNASTTPLGDKLVLLVSVTG